MHRPPARAREKERERIDRERGGEGGQTGRSSAIATPPAARIRHKESKRIPPRCGPLWERGVLLFFFLPTPFLRRAPRLRKRELYAAHPPSSFPYNVSPPLHDSSWTLLFIFLTFSPLFLPKECFQLKIHVLKKTRIYILLILFGYVFLKQSREEEQNERDFLLNVLL